MDVLGRYKNLVALVIVLFVQVLGLAIQVKRSGAEAGDTRLIRIWAVAAVTPLERGVVWVENGVSGIWHNYFYLRGVRAENRDLKQQIEQMRLEQVRLREDAAQAQRLQSLLAFKEQTVSKTVAAQVIGSGASDLSRLIYIDKGDNADLKPDMAVITADGVIGKVLQVFPSVSQVLLIDDQTSGVGAILEKTRLQGTLRGTSNGEVMLEHVMSDEQVPLGERVLTSGGDGIFPKGLPIGVVAKVNPGKDLFLNIRVKPAADLSKLEEVLVLIEKQDRPMAEVAGRVRAADILAQRLPSVPNKPADANGAKPGSANTTPAGASGTKPPASTQATTTNKPQTGAAAKPNTSASAPKPVGITPIQTQAANTNPSPAGTSTDSPAPAKPKANPSAGNSQAANTPGASQPTPSQKKADSTSGNSVPKTSKPADAADQSSAKPANTQSTIPQPTTTQPTIAPATPPTTEDSPH